MYQAELARILQVTCSEIGGFASGIQFLNVNSEAAEQAIKFVRLYESLYEKLLFVTGFEHKTKISTVFLSIL